MDDIYDIQFVDNTAAEGREARQQVEAIIAALTAERDAWRFALQSLTPGGSEFTEPHECARFVKDQLASRWDGLKRMKAERDALTDLLANIQECRKLGDFMLRKQINTALELYEEQTKGT